MAWVLVQGRRYYCRHRRIGGRSRRIHVGRGPAAEMAAAIDELRRLGRAIQRRQLEEERKRLQGAGAALEAVCEGTDVLARAALVAAGFYRHDRGEWRRYREHERAN
jgi:hypothetical protein